MYFPPLNSSSSSSSNSRCKRCLLTHLVCSLYLFFQKQIPIVRPHIWNIRGQILSYMTSSLLNKLPVIVRGTDPVSVFMVRLKTHFGHLTMWHAAHSFHFLNLLELNCFASMQHRINANWIFRDHCRNCSIKRRTIYNTEVNLSLLGYVV